MIRLRAGVNYALLGGGVEGVCHCGLPALSCSSWLEKELLQRRVGPVGRFEESGAPSGPMEPGLIQGALDLETRRGARWWPTPWLVNPPSCLAHLQRD